MRRGRAALLGSGENVLNLIDARDVAAGAILAAQAEIARGQAYNLASNGEITQRQLYDVLADALELPRVSRRVPLAVAKPGALAMEFAARVLHGPRPLITRHGISLICRPPRYSIEKAARELNWRPQVSALEGVRRMASSMRGDS
jgi:nucleoside-diphosphate-sugar epimerase